MRYRSEKQLKIDLSACVTVCQVQGLVGVCFSHRNCVSDCFNKICQLMTALDWRSVKHCW